MSVSVQHISLQSKPFGIVQPKLTIGQPNDEFEQEADRVADAVMMMPASHIPTVQRKCAKCEEEEEGLQMKPLSATITPIVQKKEEEEEEGVLQMKGFGSDTSMNSGLNSSLQKSKGKGQHLDSTTNHLMSNSIGANFSQVKVHTDTNAIQMNRQLNARAFTNGSDVYFNQGQYDPNSSAGKHLLAHELTHVVQQGAASGGSTTPNIQKDDCTPSGEGPLLSFGGIPPGLECDADSVNDNENLNCCNSDIRSRIPGLYQTAKTKTDTAIGHLSGSTNVDAKITEHFGSHALASRDTILANLRTIRTELNNRSSHVIICRAKPCYTAAYQRMIRANPNLFCRHNVQGSYTPGTRRITLCTNIDGNLVRDAWELVLHEVVHLAGIGDLMNRADPRLTAAQRTAGEYEVYRGEDNYANAFSLRNADSYSEFVKDVSSADYTGGSTAIYAAPNITLGAVSALHRFRPGMIGRLTWSPLGGNVQFIVGANGIWFPPSDTFDDTEVSGLRAYTGAELGLSYVSGSGSVAGHVEVAAGAGTYIRQDGEVDLGLSARLSGGVRFGRPGAGISINADVQRLLHIRDGAVAGGATANWYGGISISGRWGTSGRPR